MSISYLPAELRRMSIPEMHALVLSLLTRGHYAGTCKFCGAPDNGTCAYPSEGKPGCVRDRRLSSSSGDLK
jgi:hypothetical protein